MAFAPSMAAGGPSLVGCWSFAALNATVALFFRDWPSARLPREAEGAFHEFESRCSRFRASSELSLLNACSGAPTSVSPELFHLLHRCRELHEVTGGLFDPAVLPQLEAAGYNRSFEQIAPQRAPIAAPSTASFASVQIDARRRAVRAPRGVRIDLGGIGKGAIVDHAAELLASAGDFLIDAGGDIRASGRGPDGDGWLVGVADPFDAESVLSTVWLRDEALATSAVTRRRWRAGEGWRHHLIDPRTGEPAETDVLSVSAVARTCVEADVFAKVALLLGAEAGTAFLERQGAGGFFVLAVGGRQVTSNWTGGSA